MSKTVCALIASALLLSSNISAFAAPGEGWSSANHNGYQNVCRTMVRAKICPTGVCPRGSGAWREAQIQRCMKHHANVRIRAVGER